MALLTAGAAAAIPMAIGPYRAHTSQLAEPLLQLSGRVLRHGGVAATDVLAVDPDAWDSALPRHVGQKALHVMAISSLVELNYSWTHGQADEELLCLRAEAAPDPCMSVHGMLRCTSASGSGRVHMAGTAPRLAEDDDRVLGDDLVRVQGCAYGKQP